jgi:hypothetical protein
MVPGPFHSKNESGKIYLFPKNAIFPQDHFIWLQFFKIQLPTVMTA